MVQKSYSTEKVVYPTIEEVLKKSQVVQESLPLGPSFFCRCLKDVTLSTQNLACSLWTEENFNNVHGPGIECQTGDMFPSIWGMGPHLVSGWLRGLQTISN